MEKLKRQRMFMACDSTDYRQKKIDTFFKKDKKKYIK